MFKFCPKCASPNITFSKGKVFKCPDCGFLYYHNTAAATGCIISVPDPAAGTGAGAVERIMFLVRGKEPSIGKLDLPGGFVDPGEGVLEGLYRELKEEIGWTPQVIPGVPLTKVFTLFASFSNVYPYKDIDYNTCDMYFCLRAPGLREQDLALQENEIAAVRFLKPEEINFGEIAFGSTRKAVQAYLARTVVATQ